MLESEEHSSFFPNPNTTILDDNEEENPYENEIRDKLGKALDDDIEDEWTQDENLPPPPSNTANPSTASKPSHNTSHNNSHNNSHNQQSANTPNSKSFGNTFNSHQNGLKHAYQHNGGQWPMVQPPQPLHPYLKVGHYGPVPGPYGPHPGYAPYPPPYLNMFPPNYGPPPPGAPGYEGGPFDSRESSEATGNNTEQSRDEDYTKNWDSQCESPGCGTSLPLDSEVFPEGADPAHRPEQLNALCRATERKVEEITQQLSETQKEIHQLRHKCGLLETEKRILETQLSQSAVKVKELEESAERERYGKECEAKSNAELSEKVLQLELQLQERTSEVERLSYQLRDTVSRKESENYESALKRLRSESEQQQAEGRKRLDGAKREIYLKDLELEKLRVELQNSVRNKMTALEGDWRRKEGELKLALEELLIALPKINLVDIKLPLVSEIHECDMSILASHVTSITRCLCACEEAPATLAAQIEDLRSECEVLRHTAAQLQDRVVCSERKEEEAVSGSDSRDRQIAFLQDELTRTQDKLQTLHAEVNSAESRADQAVSRERGALERLAEAEGRCEEAIVEQTATLKRLRATEENGRLSRQGLENRIEEYRLKLSEAEAEVDRNKQLYVSLSQEREQGTERARREYEARLENLTQKASDEMRIQVEELRVKYEGETTELLNQKEEEMLSQFAEEREQIHQRFTQTFERRLEQELEQSQRHWSGSTQVSTLSTLELVHRGCQTDKHTDAHYGKIWQKERETELAMARDTAVALARASWEKESEKAIRTRVEILVRSKKEAWEREAAQASEKEVERLKEQLREAVARTEDIRSRVETEFKATLSKSNEEYKAEVDKLLTAEYEKCSEAEKRAAKLSEELSELRQLVEELQTENRAFTQRETKQRDEVDKLNRLFEQLKRSEGKLRESSAESGEQISALNKRIQESANKEEQVRKHCEEVMARMREELVRYAAAANAQALEYVERAVVEGKESTASKYKKYYQKLLYCLAEKHPTVKGTIKHLQQTLPKQVSRTPTVPRPDTTVPRPDLTVPRPDLTASQDSAFCSQGTPDSWTQKEVRRKLDMARSD